MREAWICIPLFTTDRNFLSNLDLFYLLELRKLNFSRGQDPYLPLPIPSSDEAIDSTFHVFYSNSPISLGII